jgi:two-component system cell cycle sensor histidine kinase/response regulator CckA
MIRVLIVDDRDESRYLLEALLNGSGYEVESACNGAEALDKARRNPPQIIISDLLMPVMDGYTLLRQWRADARLKSIPFVVYTATYTDPKDEQLALSLGTKAFILKPAEPAEFTAQLKEILANSAVQEAAASPLPAPAASGRIPVAAPDEEETRNLRQYSEVLIHKLEDKMEELEKANRELQRDVAERSHTEEALRESEERYKALFNRSLDCVFLTDFRGNFLDANQAALDMLGYRREDITTHTFESLLTQDQLPLAFRMVEEVKATGHQKHLTEYRLFRKDGKQVYVETQSSLIYHDGKPFALQGIARDVTERKQMEEERARLAAAVEQTGEAVIITDEKGAMVYVNPAFEKTTGYTRQEAMGQNPRLLKSDKHEESFFREMWNLLAQGGVWSGRIVNKKKNGTLYEADVTISPIRDSAGKIINYVAVQRDVTQEAALETQLRQSQKMDAIGQLASGVAHDFNNILTVIHGNATLQLVPGMDAYELADCTQQIIQAAERAASLTRQLLLFSRKQVLQPANLDLNEVVGGMIKMLRRILGEDVTLCSELASTSPLLYADAGMIEQVLLNLAVNSRDAMPAGGRLTITTGTQTLDEEQAQRNSEAAAGHYVYLDVADTGGGIPPEVLPRIFEPFFTTKKAGKGTGLGLATVHGIVKQHGGWITIKSEAGKGTAFRIYLPALKEGPAGQGMVAAPARLPGGKETILLVEDEAPLRLLMSNVLQRCGYTVIRAESGVAALKLWKESGQRVDLLFTDLVMPDGMSGFELAGLASRREARIESHLRQAVTAPGRGRGRP